jgi:hypothetical protein
MDLVANVATISTIFGGQRRKTHLAVTAGAVFKTLFCAIGFACFFRLEPE